MTKAKRLAQVHPWCVACGTCKKRCPVGAISFPKGTQAVVNPDVCIGCGACARACPGDMITIVERGGGL